MAEQMFIAFMLYLWCRERDVSVSINSEVYSCPPFRTEEVFYVPLPVKKLYNKAPLHPVLTMIVVI
jgi:hypothetical protein